MNQRSTAQLLRASSGVEPFEVLRLVWQEGANVNFQDEVNGRQSPLHIATVHNHADVCASLLEAGAHTSPKNLTGDTPLHIAASKGYLEVCKKLLNGKAEPGVKDCNDRTAAELASVNGHRECFQLIEAAREAREEERASYRSRQGSLSNDYARRPKDEIADALGKTET